MDVAKTPMTDLNLSRTEIPALLIEAEERPYSLQGLGKCAQLVAAVKEFDSVLGPDLDLPQSERARFSKGRIAQWVVGSFIPFRGLIRELSGANRQQREIGLAIQAGLARRGFLKGVGAARGCRYPASPATESIVAQHAAQIARGGRVDDDEAHIEADPAVTVPPPVEQPQVRPKVIFTSEPVIQRTD
jgi:hypothetical protein